MYDDAILIDVFDYTGIGECLAAETIGMLVVLTVEVNQQEFQFFFSFIEDLTVSSRVEMGVLVTISPLILLNK